MGSIPISTLVDVVPSVDSAGGTALDLNGLFLTQNTRAPIGTVLSFPTAAAVGSYFGLTSTEYSVALQYFQGFTGATATPGAILFAQYNETAVAGWLRGGPVSTLSLTALQAITGSLSITVDGYTFTVASLNLSTATSFSSAATLIQAALAAVVPAGATAPTVVYDSLSGAFVITSGTTGSSSSVVCTAISSASNGLGLTAQSGSTASPGAAAATPGTYMPGIVNKTTNWASFTTTWAASQSDAIAFAAWTTAQNSRFLFVPWDASGVDATAGETTSLAYLIGPNGSNSAGSAPVYSPVNGVLAAAFALGFVAAIDFSATNGRATLAYKSAPGLTADVTDAATAANLTAAGYNFYGAYATANQTFTFMMPGSVTGQYAWLDSYVNQIWLTNQLQLAITVGLTQAKSVPYAAIGYATILSWLQDPVSAAVNFGAITPGIALSAAQIQLLKNQAGLDISGPLRQYGYYIQVLPATAQTRAARTSPPCKLWYADGGSVQSITLASIEVQ